MSVAFIIIGMLVVAMLAAFISAVYLRIIASIIRLLLHKCNNPSYDSTSTTENLSYRDIIISGHHCLCSFYQSFIACFINLITFVDGISEPKEKQSYQEANKCDGKFPSHADKFNTSNMKVQLKGNRTII
jgi:hypothetical protein